MAKKKNNKSKSKSSKTNITKSSSITNTINTEVIAAAITSVTQPILIKVCRLCESKDGPFLNIFDSEKVTAKKIEELMPFWIAENDDLPHKICFRCSAKVEELHEFVQKCIRTQESLRKAIEKKEPLPVKTKTRTIWEEKLNKSNMSNDDICDALIKKAMEGIRDIPKPLSQKENETCLLTKGFKGFDVKSNIVKQQESINSEKDDDDRSLKDIKLSKNNKNNFTRSSRSSQIETAQDENESVQNASQSLLTRNSASKLESYQNQDKPVNKNKNIDDDRLDNSATIKQHNTSNKDKPELESNPKPTFNIMEHVSMIKVNGVGVLFQCKLCNRNFLKKEVVLTHGCAKSGVPKIDISNMYIPPEPPKVATVKYINTRISKDKNIEVVEHKSLSDNEGAKSTLVSANVKRKIGPASKIGRPLESSNVTNETVQSLKGPEDTILVPPVKVLESPNLQTPVVNFPVIPSLNSRYKLLPGPNNTFTLVEDQTTHNTTDIQSTAQEKPSKSKSPEVIDLDESPDDDRSKNIYANTKKNSGRAAPRTTYKASKQKPEKESSSQQQPYPVGLFQTVAHHSNSFNTPPSSEQVPFTTPAMKKQSYTIVQTGNPSKLLISTKPHQAEEELPKKRPRKPKNIPQNDDNSKEPFSVVLEDTAPPKDSGFFSFINVDPLLQPSYVLPTDNIIQESQITTSTPIANKEPESSKDKDKDKYTCNMCGEKFNREKKLNAHIYSHYNVEEEDQAQDEIIPKKRRK